MKKFILIRGPSGTGKSTIAAAMRRRYMGNTPMSMRAHIPTCVLLEADSFHTKADGSYHFDPDRLSKAHQWCMLNTEFHMFRDTELIIVSNTSTTKREALPYLDLAESFGYEIEVIRTPSPWDPNILFERNAHNVPLEIIEKQIGRYTPLDLHREKEWTDLSVFQE